MGFSEYQWWFILKFFLPDYLSSSKSNEIGEWILGRIEQQPRSFKEIDIWFKEWMEQLLKQQEVGWEFIKRKNLKGINRNRKEFYLDVWENAKAKRENEGGDYIGCYCSLLEDLSNGIIATRMREIRKKRKERPPKIDKEAERRKKFTQIKKAIIKEIYNPQ